MLGIILSPLGVKTPRQYPNEIGYTYGGSGEYLCPFDPQFNTLGERGWYFDTQFGGLNGLDFAIPTDAELSTVYQYTPVEGGWVAGKEGYFPSNWIPPSGWNPAGPYGPSIALSGPDLAAVDVTLPTQTTQSDAQAIVDSLNAQNNRMFKVAIISTVVVGLAALINSYRTLKQLRRDEALLRRSISQ